MARLFRGEDPDVIVAALAEEGYYLEIEDLVDRRGVGGLRVGGRLLAVYRPLSPSQRHDLGRPADIVVADILDLWDFRDLWSLAAEHESVSMEPPRGEEFEDEDEDDEFPARAIVDLTREAHHDLARIPPGPVRRIVLRSLSGENVSQMGGPDLEIRDLGERDGQRRKLIGNCILVYRAITSIERNEMRGVEILVTRILYPAEEF